MTPARQGPSFPRRLFFAFLALAATVAVDPLAAQQAPPSGNPKEALAHPNPPFTNPPVIMGNAANLCFPLDASYSLVNFCASSYGCSGEAVCPDQHNDDDGSLSIALPFTFCLYGVNYNSVFINNNGNLSFTSNLCTFTASGFPLAGTPMVAPFWADVDTRPNLGNVWFKFIAGNTLVVIWDNVGYFSQHGDKRNTFEVAISNGANPTMGGGNNVCFCYDDMQWTTGDASGGVNGFGGTAATVGINSGNGIDFVQVGRFDHAGFDYDGPFGSNDGISYLDNKRFCFNACTPNIPPVPINFPPGDRFTLTCNQVLDHTVGFTSPEAGQTTTVVVADLDGAVPRGLVITNTPGNPALVRLQWTPDCTDAGTYRLRLTATDDGVPPQQTIKMLTIVVVGDTTPPVLSGCPGNATVQCNAVPPPANPTATDNCDPAPTISFGESRVDGGCPDNYTLTRTWRAKDACNNTSSCSQVITVRDTTAPVLTCPASITVECDAVVGATPTVTDNCDPSPAFTYTETRVDGSCADTYTLTRNWTATDRCANSATCTQTINVQDTTPPTFSGCPANVTAQCDVVPPQANPTATDNCDPAPTITFSEVRANGNCQDNYTLTRTWIARDRCNNSRSCVQVVTVQDTTAPVLSGCPANVTAQCDAVPPHANPTATDNCDPAPTITFSEARSNGNCQDNYTLTRTWIARDRCSNTSSCVQVVTVQDTTAPVLSGCPANVTAQCDAVPPHANPTATDNCDPALTITFSEVRANGNCQDNYTLTRTWIARDRCNNSRSCVQVVTLQDTTAPVLSGCPANVTVQCDAVPPHANPTATDNCDPAPTITFSEVRANGNCQDNYTLTRTWIARDRCNNSRSCVQVVTLQDTTAPVLSGCPANVTAQCDAVPPHANPTATDNCDPAPTITFSEARSNGNCQDNYTLTRTWIARDRCSNTSSCVQVVTVQDTTPPVLSGCPANVTAQCDAVPPHANPTATDNCDPALTITFSEVRANGNCQDNYTLTRTWIARDRCSNTSSCVQVVTLQDTTAPVLSGCPANVTVQCDAVPPHANPTATDNCDPAPTISFGEVRTNGPCLDTYTLSRTWTARDRCNNTATCSQTVNVQDTIAPVLSGCPANVTVECDAVPAAAHPTATDNCDPAPTVSLTETRVNGSCPNNYVLTRTWTARDRCGNTATCAQVITVHDTTAPVIVGPPDPLACLWPPNHKYVCFNHFTQLWTVRDNCSAVVTLGVNCVSDQCDDAPCPGHPGENGDGNTVNDCVYNPVLDRLCVRSERAGTNPGGRHYTVTLTATDECGNSSSGHTTIYVPHDQSPHEDCIKPPHGNCCTAP